MAYAKTLSVAEKARFQLKLEFLYNSKDIKGLHVEHQNDENFSFFGQTKRGQRQLSSKKLTNLLVGGANTVERVKILFNERTSHAYQNGFVN